MRILLASNHLGLGGSESYLLTVAEQLDRLAHEVTIFAPELGNGVGAARERGLAVVDEIDSREGEFDVALVQDAGVSYRIAGQCPGTPQLFVAHSESFNLQAPPQLDGAVGAVVALNDRVASRLRGYEVRPEVVRLRQPINTERFIPLSPLEGEARRALLLSNTPHDDRLATLEAACEGAGLELARLGGAAGQVADPRQALMAADIVIGFGRSILEAMACGRAAYVYDSGGGDGWVTPDSYPAIESDGIAGRSGRTTIDGDRLREDLKAFDPAMGPVNRDLVVAHHRANVHAQELVELIGRLGSPPSRPRGPLEEMARLVRLEWRGQVDVRMLRDENARLRHETNERDRVRLEEIGQLRRKIEVMEDSTSWRLTRPLRALSDRLRRR